MDTNVRFRNTFLMVIENILSMGSLWFMVILSMILEENSAKKSMVILALLGITLVVVIFHIIGWAKTFIMFDGQTLVVEKNTLFKSSTTVALANISNVNINRNILQAILGFRKIKVDTNTSFGSEAEIEIYLKTADAYEFQKHIMELVKGEPGAENVSQEIGTENDSAAEDTSVPGAASLKEIAAHCFYTLKFVEIFMIALWSSFLIMFAAVPDEWDTPLSILKFMGIFSMIIGIIGIVITVSKSFLAYYKLDAVRIGDELTISYGFFDKKQFRIPVRKIGAVKIRQPLLGRIFQRYYAEIACVGMGDEQNELSLISLCTTRDKLALKLKALVPEFIPEKITDTDTIYDIKPETTKALSMRISSTLLLAAIIFAGLFISRNYLHTIIQITVFPVGIATGCVLTAYCILKNRTTGISCGEKFIRTTEGAFSKTQIIAPYNKIEYLTIERGIAYKLLKLSQINIVIKGALVNIELSSGYTDDATVDFVKEKYRDVYKR